MTTKTNTPSVDFIIEATRVINAWQMRRLNLVQSISEKTLASLTSTPAIDIDSLPNDLDKLLFNDLNPHLSTSSGSSTIGFNEPDDDYGGDDEEERNSVDDFSGISTQQWQIRAPSEQMSIDSSATSTKGQAMTIKQTTNISYPCYSDNNNGVMALNGNELVYIDWVWKQDRSSGRHKIRIVNTKQTNLNSDHQRQENFRSIICPYELEGTRFVDMDYASYMSKYMMALVERISPDEQSPMARKSLIYLFDSTKYSFERWEPFCNTSDRLGLVTRLCCCLNRSVIYLIMNVFGQSDLIILKGNGNIQDRKQSDDLPLPEPGARLVDVACTANNDQIALAFNSSTSQSSGYTGVCLVHPQTWTRTGSIELHKTDIPFTLPRLTWVNDQDFFALIDQHGELLVFNRDAQTLGRRTFTCPKENQENNLYPRNICATQNLWIAMRYDRFITIHRVLV